MNVNTLSNIIHNLINYDSKFSTFDIYMEYKRLEKSNVSYNKCKKTILSAINEILTSYNYKKSYTSINNNVYTQYTPIKSAALAEYMLNVDYRGRIYIPQTIVKYLNIIKDEYVIVKYSDKCIYVYPLDSNETNLNSSYKSSYVKANKSNAILLSVGISLAINNKIKIYAYDNCLIIPFSNE